MVEFTDTFFYKIRFLMAGATIIVCLLLLPFLPHLLWINPPAQAANTHSDASTKNSDMKDSPNAITRGMLKGADGLERIAGSAEKTVSNSFHSAANSIASATVKSGKFVVHGVASATTATASAAGSSVKFIARSTGSVFSSIANTSVVSAIIRPADKDALPVIDSNTSELANSRSAQPSQENNSQVAPQPDSKASWPMRGVITTAFGVPHWPYQPTHTGIDISDRKPSGMTPIRPFKPGVVTDTVRSNNGLGNHVIIDHGEGLASVYGHFASISVSVGQAVDKNTILGYEGSTGVSTGAHLHFEINLNGQPVDPRKYIDGQP